MNDELAPGEPSEGSRHGEQSNGSILWVDDDGPARFMYEELLLERSGWAVHWAGDVMTAAKCLASQTFTRLILDQLMPLRPGGQETVWGGFHVLAWLRGASGRAHAKAPPLPEELRQLAPLEANRGAPVIIASAFSDDAVDEALRQLVGAAGILVAPKPLDPTTLIAFLEGPK